MAPALATEMTPYAVLHGAGAPAVQEHLTKETPVPDGPTPDLSALFGGAPEPAADDLSGLFGDSGTPTPAADPAPEQAPASELAPVVPEVPAAPVTTLSAAEELAAPSTFSFDSIFGATPAPQQGAPVPEQPTESAVDAVEPAPATSAATSSERVPEELPEPATAVDVPSPVAPSPFPGAPAFGAAATNPFAATPAAEPALVQPESAPQSAPRRNRVAEQRAAVEAAKETAKAQGSAGPSAQTLSLAFEQRYTHAEEFSTQVQRLLGLGANGEPRADAFIHRLTLTRDAAADARQRAEYQALFEPMLAAAGVHLQSADEMSTVFDIAYDELIGIGPLGPLWRDDSINDILVSGPDKVTIERNGKLEITPVRFRDLEHLEKTARQLAQVSKDDRAISPTNPLVTIQLPGARVQFVWHPIAVAKVAISIRKFGQLMGMSQLLSFGSLTPEMANFLDACVRARATILVSGGTSAGKTTFINALSESIPSNERVVTIEDALELQLRNTHVEALVTKEAASADDLRLFGQEQLLTAALRLNPDRIIVGEIRDGKGAAVMLEAANTGHAGTMTTIHANNPPAAVQRLGKLLRRADNVPMDVAHQEVTEAISVIVQVVSSRGRKYVSHITAVDSVTGTLTDMYVGTFPAGASGPTFSRPSTLRPDTELALMMLDAGLDPSAWEE